jgi:hypothetical protein
VTRIPAPSGESASVRTLLGNLRLCARRLLARSLSLLCTHHHPPFSSGVLLATRVLSLCGLACLSPLMDMNIIYWKYH